MPTHCLRASAFLLGLASILAVPCATALASTSERTSPPSDAALAASMNVTMGELPTSTAWVSTKAMPRPTAETTQDEQTITCMKKAGGAAARISSDPFGTVGVPGGVVTADVTSPSFSPKSSTDGLPEVSSEVDMVTTAAQATSDLAAFATQATLACFAHEFANIYSAELNTKLNATTSFLPLSRFGSGNGGVHGRYVITGGNLKAPLYDDAYFYAQGRAEIFVQFADLGAPFPSSWATSVVAKVMTRAHSLVG